MAGGETTTTLRPRRRAVGRRRPEPGGRPGGRRGARAQRPRRPPACLLCLDSDGTDGPGHAAGGLVDDLSAAALAAAGVDLQAALAAHAAGTALEAAGDRVFTGPTGTNVNDLKVGLVGAALMRSHTSTVVASISPTAASMAPCRPVTNESRNWCTASGNDCGGAPFSRLSTVIRTSASVTPSVSRSRHTSNPVNTLTASMVSTIPSADPSWPMLVLEDVTAP